MTTWARSQIYVRTYLYIDMEAHLGILSCLKYFGDIYVAQNRCELEILFNSRVSQLLIKQRQSLKNYELIKKGM